MMQALPPRMLLACVLAGLLARSSSGAPLQPAGLTRTDAQTVPPRELRGYGTLSAELTRFGARASHLQIQCAGEDSES